MSDKKLSLFDRVSSSSSNWLGQPISFMLSLLLCVAWGLTGPLFGFTDTWQLLINTPTTILTFLFLFLVQNTEIRNSKATHAKLDALTSNLASFMEANKETDTSEKELIEGIKDLKTSVGMENKISAAE